MTGNRHTFYFGLMQRFYFNSVVRKLCNRSFGGVFVLSTCFLDFSVCLGAFVIGLSQISSFCSVDTQLWHLPVIHFNLIVCAKHFSVSCQSNCHLYNRNTHIWPNISIGSCLYHFTYSTLRCQGSTPDLRWGFRFSFLSLERSKDELHFM